ncbi:hypothetical protein BHF71_09980 [Vulcanibacillus modesticaldus]|uniref:Uncharacterized protein n=1 Tax=Vulcanibacillus modesticaldus TaxID=337097 RepID=A0A1D2YTX9_9BACI|nr:hypothetical protein [Vulcanibacillus modesticaldus]OEF99153.1 hypothetical protein BHF71_09980 [Vulcanibacillus modesticaldus]
MTLSTFLTNGLLIKKVYKEVVDMIKTIDDYLQEQDFEDVKELSSYFFSGKVPYGTIVNLQGRFSEYSHTYHPYTYMPTFPQKIEHKKISPYRGSIKFRFDLFQPPVETIPEINVEGKNYKIGFIYPNNFTGFIYEPAYKNYDEALQAGKPYLHLPDSAKPIPIIYKLDRPLNNGDIYIIKAKIIELPYEHLKVITRHLYRFPLNIYERAIDLFSSDKKSLCLLVDSEPTYIKETEQFSPEKFPMTFFIETHIENDGTIKDIEQLIRNSIPDLADKKAPIKSTNYKGFEDYFGFFTNGNVYILYRRPSIIGFYVEVDPMNNLDYQEKISELHGKIRKFNRQLQNMTDRRIKLHVDFISDRRLINILGLQRVLESNELEKILKEYPEFIDTRNWLTKK